MSNELANQNNQEVLESKLQVVGETEGFVKYYNPETKKYSRKAKFKDYSSVKAETKQEKIWLMNLIENDEETGNALSDHVKKEIEVADVITRRYDKVNEDTGELEYGVLTYLLTPEKEAFVTSSKSVYFSVQRIFDLFGKPDEEGWENVKVKVGSEKGQNGTMIKIKLIG